MAEAEPAPSPTRTFHCSFCFKSQAEVVKLIAGPGVFICNECVAMCVPIMAAEPTKALEPNAIMTPDSTPTELLLRVLATHNTAFEKVDRSMQDVADILRERGVSWAVIGETLGVSRQAAWKRFG